MSNTVINDLNSEIKDEYCTSRESLKEVIRGGGAVRAEMLDNYLSGLTGTSNNFTEGFRDSTRYIVDIIL